MGEPWTMVASAKTNGEVENLSLVTLTPWARANIFRAKCHDQHNYIPRGDKFHRHCPDSTA